LNELKFLAHGHKVHGVKHLLAIMIILLGVQPLPARACDMDAEPTVTSMEGHAGHAAMEAPAMDCCDTPGEPGESDCPQTMDCSQSPTSAPAVLLSQLPNEHLAAGLAPLMLREQVPYRITAPPFRPPIS
jgi:hypothetical protein